MTAEEIRALPAGRDLDALVAERVMGWGLIDRRAAGWGPGPEVWDTGEDPDDPDSSPTRQEFRPSQDVADATGAAFRVLGRREPADPLRDGMADFRCGYNPYRRVWVAAFSWASGHHVGAEAVEPLTSAGAALPLAVSRAAVLAFAQDAPRHAPEEAR